MRQVDQRAIVLVEGQEDTALIDPHLNQEACRSEIAFGKQAVLRAAHLAELSGYSTVYAVVDRDFDSETDLQEYGGHISVSEYYDMQVDIFRHCPGILQRLLAAHADREKLRSHMHRLATRADDLLVQIAGRVGALRLLSVKKTLGILLKDFPMAPLIEAHENGELVEKISVIAIGRTKAVDKPTAADLQSMLEATIAEHNLALLCAGHDLVNLLSALASGRWGGPSGSDAMGRAYRSTTDWECFAKLRVCADLRTWGEESGLVIWERDLVS